MHILVNEAVLWTQANFKKQQWDGKAWPVRKKESRLSRGKSLLIGKGRLYRAIQVVDDHSFGVLGVPYARIHNEGGTITQAARSNNFVQNRFKRGTKKGKFKRGKLSPAGGAGGGRMSFKQRIIHIPQRRFIGNSPALRQHLINKAKNYLKQ